MHRLVGAAALLSWTVAGPLAGQDPQRFTSDLSAYRWDLDRAFPSEEDWQAERAWVLDAISRAPSWAGLVQAGADGVALALDSASELRARAGRMALFGILANIVDTDDEVTRRRHDEGTRLEIEVDAAVGAIDAAVLALGADSLVGMTARHEGVARHRRRLGDALQDAPYRLAADAEVVLQTMRRWPQSMGAAYWALMEAEHDWPMAELGGDAAVPVDRTALRRALAHADEQIRVRAVREHFELLMRFEHAFGLLLARRIEADHAHAGHRGFERGVDAEMMLRDGVPPGSAEVMVEVARRHRSVLRRYVALRARTLGVGRGSYADLFRRPPAIDRAFPVDQALALAVRAVEPLGAAYQERLAERLTRPAMHLPPAPDKRPIYGIFYPVGGLGPYVVMSYDDSYVASRAIAGAATLMMAYADIPTDAEPDTRLDPAIYSNAVLYAGNLLHDRHLAETAVSPLERAALLQAQLDRLWNTFFRWVISAELELAIEDQLRAGNPPSGAHISEMYGGLLEDYYGPEVVDPEARRIFGREWMQYDVSFHSYEHLFWPPAMAAAVALLEQVERADQPGPGGLTGLLGRGRSDRSYHLLRSAGIDLATPAPYEALMRAMEDLMADLERTLAELGR